MVDQNQRVISQADDWAVRGEGCERAISIHLHQGDAERPAPDIAINQQSEIIHRPAAWIRDKNSYGHDPYPPKS